ncbi:hypothetical protein MF672_031575 [Actinomadura sp. ATCC 31491]|uniref:Uncharacterized protein n=1 Tax=Actinomadura luzonensis TaxID=2805427 RepID=A0ABT0G1L8_9ACTN|nr:hypothetical protein [Actinomadura luzonensis]MCK2218298.1 hypothetical protein [Actinomadura luzonensis]
MSFLSRARGRVLALTLALPAAVLPGVAPPALAAAARADQNYVVEVQNYSSQGFDEMVLAVSRFSNPAPELMSRPGVPPFTVVSFDLGPCGDVRQYAVSGLVGGERLFTTGDVDGDPIGCNDVITIGDRTGALAGNAR